MAMSIVVMKDIGDGYWVDLCVDGSDTYIKYYRGQMGDMSTVVQIDRVEWDKGGRNFGVLESRRIND